MNMHNPPHPGEVIRELCLRPLDVTVTEAADALGVTRKALSDLLNGHSGVSPEMAIRLEKVGWGTADHWLRTQSQRDLWLTRKRASKIKIRRQFAKRLQRDGAKRIKERSALSLRAMSVAFPEAGVPLPEGK
jgi:addiction module HigA family antidote